MELREAKIVLRSQNCCAVFFFRSSGFQRRKLIFCNLGEISSIMLMMLVVVLLLPLMLFCLFSRTKMSIFHWLEIKTSANKSRVEPSPVSERHFPDCCCCWRYIATCCYFVARNLGKLNALWSWLWFTNKRFDHVVFYSVLGDWELFWSLFKPVFAPGSTAKVNFYPIYFPFSECADTKQL